MKRRDFIVFVGGLAAAPPTAAAQQGRKAPTIGVLGVSTAANWAPWMAAFNQRLRELGWIEGSTVAIEYRWADGRTEAYDPIAAGLVQRNVDVILTVGSAVLNVQRVSSKIPIVFAIAVDPIGTGMVASLARPGGNATGLSTQTGELASKRIELARELIPGLRRLAIIGNIGYLGSRLEIAEVQSLGQRLGIEIIVLGIRSGEDVPRVFDMIKGDVQALYVCPDALVNAHHARINTLALAARLPTLHPFRDYIGAGGFMSYGANNVDLFRRSAEIVDKILRGANPADIPVEQPTKFDLVINLTTAKALGLKIPETFLLRADEVIE